MSLFYPTKREIGCTLFIISFLLLQLSLFAQTGSIGGIVKDKTTNESLLGANVIIEGTSLGAATDPEGRFIIRQVPAGQQTIRISYIGYSPIIQNITVIENRTVEEEFFLDANALEGEIVTITAQAEGQLSAINQQLTSNTIANIVSKARIEEMPDVNAAESIGRLPGVSIERSGGEANKVSIRGLEPKYNIITVNGVRVPSTGSDDRSVDLSLISSNMLDGITMKKAVTSDMDADALGGTVDLKLKEAPEGFHFNGSAQGGYNDLQDYYGNYNFTGSVSNRFFENKFGVILNLNVDNYDRSADKFQGDYIQTGSGENIVVQPNQIRLRDESVKRKRTGASILLDYKLVNGKITLNSFYNHLNTEALNRVNFMDLSHNSHYYDLEDREGNTSIFTGSVAIEQDFDWLKYDFAVSRTSSNYDSPDDLTWGFVQENGAFDTGGLYPGMDPHLIPSLQIIDTAITGYRSAFLFDTDRKENETALQLNIQMPVNINKDITGYIKFGTKFRWLDKMNDQEQYGRDYIQYGGVGLNNVIEPALGYLAENYPEDWNWQRDSALAATNAVFPISDF